MKKFLSIFLPSLLVVACFLWVFPLNSLADTIWLENTNVWSIPTGNYSSNVIHGYDNLAVIRNLTYDSSTGWTQFSFQIPLMLLLNYLHRFFLTLLHS